MGEGTRRSNYQARPSSSAFFPYSSAPLLCPFGMARAEPVCFGSSLTFLPSHRPTLGGPGPYTCVISL